MMGIWSRQTLINEFYGGASTFIEELVQAMKGTKWYDNPNAMIDYFDTAYYLILTLVNGINLCMYCVRLTSKNSYCIM